MVYYNNTSLQVATGSGTSVHKLVEHGNMVLAAAGDNRIIEVSCSSEFGDRSLGGGTGNSLSSGVIANGVFRIPLYNKAVEGDVGILNTIAASPSSYNGYMFYMTSEQGVTKGDTVGSTTVTDTAGQYFGRGAVMYYCRNGKWFHDGLVTVSKKFIQKLLTSFTGSTSWHVSTGSDNFLNYAASLVTAPMTSEYDTGWGTVNPSEPSWTYGTHKRLTTNFSGSGTNTWHVSTGSDTFVNYAASLVTAPFTQEYNTGWGTVNPNEPSWTYGTHKRITTNFSGSGTNTWHVSTGSDTFVNYAASLVTAPLTNEPGTGWGTVDPNEPTWTYGTHKRITTNFSGSGTNTWHVSTGSDNFVNYAASLITAQTFVSASWKTGATNHY